jgi:hypothetical protein
MGGVAAEFAAEGVRTTRTVIIITRDRGRWRSA